MVVILELLTEIVRLSQTVPQEKTLNVADHPGVNWTLTKHSPLGRDERSCHEVARDLQSANHIVNQIPISQ